MKETRCCGCAVVAPAISGQARSDKARIAPTTIRGPTSPLCLPIAPCWLASNTGVSDPSLLERLERELGGLPLLTSAGRGVPVHGSGVRRRVAVGRRRQLAVPHRLAVPGGAPLHRPPDDRSAPSDVVLVLWFAFALAVYLLDMSIVTAVLERGLSDTEASIRPSSRSVRLGAAPPASSVPQLRLAASHARSPLGGCGRRGRAWCLGGCGRRGLDCAHHARHAHERAASRHSGRSTIISPGDRPRWRSDRPPDTPSAVHWRAAGALAAANTRSRPSFRAPRAHRGPDTAGCGDATGGGPDTAGCGDATGGGPSDAPAAPTGSLPGPSVV